MEELITLNVVIADRTFRIKVSKHQEEHVRLVCKTVNDKIIEYKANFAAKDTQDLLSMALLWVATNAQSTHSMHFTENEALLKSTSEKLDKLLEKYAS